MNREGIINIRGLLLFLLMLFIISCSNSQNSKVHSKTFQTIISNENNVEFSVKPLSPSEFEVSIITHSVSLDFDLVEISTMYDDFGNSYKPLSWDGSEPGGHHRDGVLKFPTLNSNAKSIKLIIVDSAKREFEWGLG